MQASLAGIPDITKSVQYLKLVLASLSSVQKAVNAFAADSDRLDVVMKNTGITARPLALTSNGFEVQFSTNHTVGSIYILTCLTCQPL